jgi:hypothetical protein
MLDSFYTTVAQASFTLLALWWVLLQIRHDEWFGDAAYRRSIYDVSLYFLLPGMMSLASLLAVETNWIWRASFAVFGAIGLAESVLLIARRGELRAAASLVRAADLVSVLLYGLVVLVAIWEKLPEDLGIEMRPLEMEGLLVSGLLLLGITLAATIFVSTGPHIAGRNEPPPPR